MGMLRHRYRDSIMIDDCIATSVDEQRGGSDDERSGKRARMDVEPSSSQPAYAMDKQIIDQLAEVKKWRNAFQKYQQKVQLQP
jgi:hypothetical protein